MAEEEAKCSLTLVCALIWCFTHFAFSGTIGAYLVAYKYRLPVRYNITSEMGDGVGTSSGQVRIDWMTKPFTDIAVVDAETKCPTSFPDEVIYNVWPGTRMMCDCLERNQEYFLDIECDRRGDSAQHASKLCYDVGGMPPIV